jgi:anti-sigma-K factor RskA
LWEGKTKLRHERSTEEKQEQAALYALGALCQHDAKMFEEALREGDTQLGTELESFEKVVEILGFSAPPIEPSTFLLDVLQTRIGRENQEVPQVKTIPFPERTSPLHALQQIVAEHQTPQHEKAVPHPNQTVTGHVAPQSNVVPWQTKQPHKSTSSTLLRWAVAASFLILAGGAAMVGFKWYEEKESNKGLRAQVALLIEQSQKIRDDIRFKDDKVYELARINQVISDCNNRQIILAGQTPAPSSKAIVYWDMKANQWLVSAELPPAPEGKVYQLWYLTAGGTLSAGLIKPNQAGHAFTEISVPPNLENLTGAGITLEPEGGSAQPTLPIYTLGSV